MARPEKRSDVKDRLNQIASFTLDDMLCDTALMRAYTHVVEAAEKAGGKAVKEWGNTVKVMVPKTTKQLDDQLETEQRDWDRADENYRKALNGDPEHELREYEKERLKDWAEQEGRPNPFDVFAATDPDLQAMREELGLGE